MAKVVTFRLDDETYEKLCLIARKRFVSKSDIIREAVKQYIQQNLPEQDVIKPSKKHHVVILK